VPVVGSPESIVFVDDLVAGVGSKTHDVSDRNRDAATIMLGIAGFGEELIRQVHPGTDRSETEVVAEGPVNLAVIEFIVTAVGPGVGIEEVDGADINADVVEAAGPAAIDIGFEAGVAELDVGVPVADVEA
jgi:hypothetical protein